MRFVTLVFALVSLSPVVSATPVQFNFVTEIPIKGKGGWDALSIDQPTHRLFVSHADRVVVIDTEKNQVIQEIIGTQGVHAIALAPEFKKGFASNGKDASVSVIDLDSLKIKSKIKVGENPDLIVFDPHSNNVYCFNGKSHSVSIIDPKNESVISTVELPGKPEFAVADPKAHRVFVNIEDKNSVLSLDTDQRKVVATWIITGCEGPTGLAIDREAHRLFAACDNEKMVMLDSESGKALGSVPTGAGADGAEFDPQLKLAFSSNGESGTTTVIHEDSPDKLSVVQNLKTQIGARTMVLDPVSHKIYLPTASFQPATEKGKRPKPVDGSQKILVYGLK